MNSLDTLTMPRQYGCAGVNPSASFRRLDLKKGRQAANYSFLSGVFTSVYLPQVHPLWWTVARGLYARWLPFSSTANLAICLPPTRFAALRGFYRLKEKGQIMSKIRTAFTRPTYAHPLQGIAQGSAA